MKFNSITQIITHFKLDVSDKEDVRKALMTWIKEIHPDKNQGTFKSDEEKELYFDIQVALQFLEDINTNAPLMTSQDVTSLIKVFSDIMLMNEEKAFDRAVENKNLALKEKIRDSISDFHKQQITPKITSVVIATLITALWAFPMVVKEHPLLGFLYTFNREFTVIWVISIMLMCILWARIKTVEKKDETIKKSYKLESIQNSIFNLFLVWLNGSYTNYDYLDNKKYLKFSKQDLIFFLTTRYNLFKNYWQLVGREDRYENRKEIERFEQIYITRFNGGRKKHSFLLNFFPTYGEIDEEIAQMICDLIIDRLDEKGIITKSSKIALSDIYEIEDEYLWDILRRNVF